MSNALADEKSPYLLQHAENPVNWLPWGPKALQKAAAEQKPIFLSVGYATCHWCHVMAHESFEDSRVAALLNEHYVPIKVDREERPDIDAIYMTACQVLSGSGGWPLTVFLTPDGQPFVAGTYFPKNARMGQPGLIQLLEEIAKRWNGPERQKMLEAGQEVSKAIQPQTSVEATLDQRSPAMTYRQLQQAYDPAHGGFGNAPKFPTPHNLSFLLRWHARNPESQGLAIVENTLEKMYTGGIFDQLGLGFHRYSVDARWLVPHFEKMLYDQALLAIACLEAYQLGGKEILAQAARDIFTYVLRDMTAPDGGFYSAEDADSEGEEGIFYVWTPQEVARIAGEADGRIFNRYYGITEGGNFEHGRSIAHVTRTVEALAKSEDITTVEARAALDRAEQKLLEVREMRPRPLKDDKVLTAWNGLMIAALAKGAAVLGDKTYRDAAAKAADFVLQNLRDKDGALLRRWREGHVSGPVFLEDYAFFIWGLLELYEAEWNLERLETALELLEKSTELFWDDEGGAYFFTPTGGEELIFRDRDFYDGATPSGNSVMALNLLKLGRITGNTAYEEMAQRTMDANAAAAMRQPMAFTMMMLAADFATGPSKEIVITGQPGDPDMKAMLDKARRTFIPARVILLRPGGGPEADKLAGLAPYTAEMTPKDGRATAYVCQGFACSAPVTEIGKLDLP